jgi:hypothetical protein
MRSRRPVRLRYNESDKSWGTPGRDGIFDDAAKGAIDSIRFTDRFPAICPVERLTIGAPTQYR